MASERENCIEWLMDSKTATVTLSQGRYISKIRKLAEKFPDEVKIIAEPENNDGYMVAHIPVKYIKLNNSSRNLTEEEREELSERARVNLANRNNRDNEIVIYETE